MADFLRFGIVQRLAWRLADRNLMRERIEEAFKRRLIVAAPPSARGDALAQIKDIQAERGARPGVGPRPGVQASLAETPAMPLPILAPDGSQSHEERERAASS